MLALWSLLRLELRPFGPYPGRKRAAALLVHPQPQMVLPKVPQGATRQAAAELAAVRGGPGRGSSGAGDCAEDGGAMNELQQAERWHLHYLSRAWYWEKQREAVTLLTLLACTLCARWLARP